jgi:hypothetical protein
VSTVRGPTNDPPPSDRLAPFKLTPEQRVIAERPYSAKQVVLAGPGTGKTHVVAARLAHLVLVQGLKPHSQTILLSYTRAAAREMRDRLSEAGRPLHSTILDTVDIRTMDSYAFGLHEAAGVPAPGGGYEEGMESALRLLVGNTEAQAAAAELKHIIVDEAQDLSGVRDHFIRALLSRCQGGFTVCADPNQAIYDYLLLEQGASADTGWEFLYTWLIQSQKASVAKIHGSKRHRGDVAKIVQRAESHLSDDALDWKAKWELLSDLLVESGTLQRWDLEETLRGLSGRTAILTRTNGEALMISEFLNELKHPIVHDLIGPPSPFSVPGWIGRILPHLPDRFGEDDVENTWNKFVNDPTGSVKGGGDAYRLLRAISGRGKADLLERAKIEHRICLPYTLPSEVLIGATSRTSLSVSTVHRAKGREFDNVVFVEPALGRAMPQGPVNQLPMEVRVLYVAMSRPKVRLSMMHLGGGATTVDDGGGKERRWYVRAWNQALPAEIELRPDDINPYSTVPEGLAERIQERIWAVRGNTDLQARETYSRGAGWELLERDEKESKQSLAVFTTRFGQAVQAVSNEVWRDAEAGRNMTKIWVEDVATFTVGADFHGSHRIDSASGKRGYWLVPIIRGFGTLWGRRRRRGWRT